MSIVNPVKMIDLSAKRSFAEPSLRTSAAQKYYLNRFLFSGSQLTMTSFGCG